MVVVMVGLVRGGAGGGCDGSRGGDVGAVAPHQGTPPVDK